jgi:hypothetical protein
MRNSGALAALLILSAGCSHPLLLKKYRATVGPRPPLKGLSVFVQPYADDLHRDWPDERLLPDPPNWNYREPTSKMMDQWDTERRKLGDGLPLEKLYSVGVKRNGFGIPIKEVFSVNSPGQWLSEATRLELAQQGALAAESAEAADVVVTGVVRYAWVDLYMATWVHLVLDLTTTARGRPPKSVRLHVSDSRVAWTAGDEESYEIFCSTEQKLAPYVLDAIAREAAQTQTDGPVPAL